jgi:hypothetical protein
VRTDEQVEPSRAIRNILAQRFSALLFVDKARAARIASAIFPAHTSTEDPARKAAWSAFLAWNGVSSEMFAVLRNFYGLSIDALPGLDEKTSENLAEHLIWLAAWGVEGAGLPAGLITRFVSAAPMSIRRHALETIGRAIHREDKGLPVEDALRLQALWDWWCDQNATADLAAFGWWMAGPALDAAWRLPRLVRVLEITGGELDLDRDACEELAGLAATFPEEVEKCLSRFVDTDHRSRVARCGKAIRETLQRLHDGPHPESAKRIAARLVARRYRQFEDLM